jgi:hypothetical protein
VNEIEGIPKMKVISTMSKQDVESIESLPPDPGNKLDSSRHYIPDKVANDEGVQGKHPSGYHHAGI